MDDFAAFLIDSLGAYAALNLDGGGSATMYTKLQGAWCETLLTVGCLVNRPDVASGADERSVPNAVMILPGPDPKDPVPAP